MRIWNVLILSSLFGLASLFATPPAPLPQPISPESAPASPAKEKPAELKGKVTYTSERSWGTEGPYTLRVEVQPDGEVIAVRNGSEVRFRLRPEIVGRLAVDLENAPIYIAPESDFEKSQRGGEEMTLLYPDGRILARRGVMSNDVPQRLQQIQIWLSNIELKR